MFGLVAVLRVMAIFSSCVTTNFMGFAMPSRLRIFFVYYHDRKRVKCAFVSSSNNAYECSRASAFARLHQGALKKEK